LDMLYTIHSFVDYDSKIQALQQKWGHLITGTGWEVMQQELEPVDFQKIYSRSVSHNIFTSVKSGSKTLHSNITTCFPQTPELKYIDGHGNTRTKPVHYDHPLMDSIRGTPKSIDTHKTWSRRGGRAIIESFNRFRNFRLLEDPGLREMGIHVRDETGKLRSYGHGLSLRNFNAYMDKIAYNLIRSLVYVYKKKRYLKAITYAKRDMKRIIVDIPKAVKRFRAACAKKVRDEEKNSLEQQKQQRKEAREAKAAQAVIEKKQKEEQRFQKRVERGVAKALKEREKAAKEEQKRVAKIEKEQAKRDAKAAKEYVKLVKLAKKEATKLHKNNNVSKITVKRKTTGVM
jgi:hypothetical protein